MRTGILGGTFDPIHIAHLHAGETALFAADLDRVLFMPAGDPWQKGARELTPAAERLEMTRLAVEETDGFEVDDREIDRHGPTYTIDTLLTFPSGEELFLILGADAAIGLPTWHRWEEVIERAGILVVPRPGTDLAAVAATIPQATILEMSALDISSTSIRELAASGRPYRFLVPSEVHRFIDNKGVYTQK
ncbi:MAG TPA: nicotinate-nucleotide adenylyltransferase [Acidimicrobiia bacterium]|nr:nicotinate-nucleotide adenylyltransferase [Acidimicrobiia bacterium]